MDQRPQSEMCTINSTKTAVLNMCVAALGRGLKWVKTVRVDFGFRHSLMENTWKVSFDHGN